MKSSISLVLFFVTLSLCYGQTPTRTLITVSKTEHKLSIVDPATLNIISQVPVGPNPHEIITSPDGKLAYVSNPGNSDLYEIDVIDLEHQRALPMIDTRPLYGPHGMAYVNGTLWFTAQGSKAVGRYNPESKSLDWSMGTGQDVTHMIYVAPDAKSFYTTNVLSGTVSIYENVLLQPTIPPTGKLPPNAKSHWDWEQTLVPSTVGSEGFDVSPDGQELWTVDADGLITIIDPIAKKVKEKVKTNILGAHRIKFTPDGKKVAVVSVRTGDLVFFEASSRKESDRLKIGQGAAMLMDPVDNRLFVSCPPDGYISVIDLNKMKEISRLNVGGRPDGLAWAITED